MVGGVLPNPNLSALIKEAKRKKSKVLSNVEEPSPYLNRAGHIAIKFIDR